MRNLIFIAVTFVCSFAFADYDLNQHIITGQASISAVTVKSEKGEIKTYSIKEPSLALKIYDLKDVHVGHVSDCAPGLGALVEDIEISAVVKEQYFLRGFDDKGQEIRVPTGMIGPVKLTVPAGSYVYGDCGSTSSELLSVAFNVRKGSTIDMQKSKP